MNLLHDAPLPPGVAPLHTDDPAQITDYPLLGRLGSGGMGTVYAAVAPDGACVALKLAHEDAPEGFDREFELMGRVRGEYAVDVHATGTFHGRRWAVIDYLPGRSLHRHVRDEGPWVGEALLVLLAGCAEAISAAHRAGVAHGDVKPGNVIVTPDGPRLVDYGIARSLTEPASAITAGSPGWLAPERYAGAPPEPASDVFAWGCLAHFATTGRGPFGTVPSGSGPREALAEMARRSREHTVDLATLPEGLADLIGRALEPEPGERPTADQVYQECLVLLGVPDEVVAVESAGVPESEFWENLLVRMRALVDEYWPDVDVSWHRPALWAPAALAVAARASTGPVGEQAAGEAAPDALGGGGKSGLTEQSGSTSPGVEEVASGAVDGIASLAGGGATAGGTAAATGGTGAAGMALGGVGAGGAATGGTAAGGGAAAAGGAAVAGTATAIGTGKVVSVVAAGGVALGVVTGGGAYLGTQFADDETASASSEESSASPAGDPEDSPGETEDDREWVEFRGLSLPLPEGWGHEFVESENVSSSTDVVESGDRLLLYPPDQPDCEDYGTWEPGDTFVDCRYVSVVGPDGIEHGGGGFLPVTTGQNGDRQGAFDDFRTNPTPCPDWTTSYAESDPAYRDPQGWAHEDVRVDGVTVSYGEGAVMCHAQEVGEMHFYDQRSWYFPDQGLLIVDEYFYEEFDDVVTEARWT